MKTVIIAGGKGTRISSLFNDIPKPLIPIEGMPILEREIACLKEQGIKDIIITVGYLGQQIIDYFGDGSKISPVTDLPFGVTITYYFEQTPLGNAGALFKIKDQLTEDFLLLNGDALFDIDFNKLIAYHKQKGAIATLLTHPNDHPYDSGLVIVNEQNQVEKWLTKEDERPHYYQNRVNAGVHVISPNLLNQEITKEKIDLDRDLLKPLSNTGKMYAYDSPEYVKDMGTPERYQEVCFDVKSGKVQQRNLRNKQKAIFLDRDGTINKYVGFLTKTDQFELIDGVSEAIKQINHSKYLVIVVTNQPVIARGEVSFEELKEIHNKMETLLGNEGAYINGLYFCPHHPDRGFEGEREEFKIKCQCRKPQPGMLLQAAKDFNIDLSQSWMVGDSKNDIEAGKNAGCQCALIGKDNYGQDLQGNSLQKIIEKIVGGANNDQ